MDRVGMSVVTILDADSPGNLDAWIKLQQKFPDRLVVFWKPSFAKGQAGDVLHRPGPRARDGLQDGRAGREDLERSRHVHT